MTIELDKVGSNSSVKLDGERIPATDVAVRASATEVTRASVAVFVDRATIELPLDQVRLVGEIHTSLLLGHLRGILKALDEHDHRAIEERAELIRKYLYIIDASQKRKP